jgi:hypothetical protein
VGLQVCGFVSVIDFLLGDGRRWDVGDMAVKLSAASECGSTHSTAMASLGSGSERSRVGCRQGPDALGELATDQERLVASACRLL